MKLSIVISTYNRAESLRRTLVSVRPFADEIVIVDNQSTDTTQKVAREFTGKIFTRPNNSMLNINKNFGISKATGDWVLYLDDDEVIPEDLAEEILTVIKKKNTSPDQRINGYWIARKNIIFGKWIEHGIWWPDRQMRLFRKGTGKYAQEHVHEYVEVEGSTGTLALPYIHYNYDSIDQFLYKMQQLYTGSEVKKHISVGYRVDWKDAIRFPVSDFIKLYFAQSGYKDGLHGLVLAGLQSFYSFIVFVKLWEMAKFVQVEILPKQSTKEMLHAEREVYYWILSAKIAESKSVIHKIWLKLLRRAVAV